MHTYDLVVAGGVFIDPAPKGTELGLQHLYFRITFIFFFSENAIAN